MKKEMIKGKIKSITKTVIQFVLNPKLLLCFGIAWIITNGWSYIMLGVGTYYQIEWMMAVAGGYLTFLWLPISPEKIVTVFIAMGLLRLIFPNDKQTLGILKGLHDKYKKKTKKRSKDVKTDEENAAETSVEKECNGL